jgi:hypothetical protein
MFVRPDRPNFWAVVGPGGATKWSYELNLARCWAASLVGEDICQPAGDTDLCAHHAYLPLPLARIVSALGAGLPGRSKAPTGTQYLYAIDSGPLREFVQTTIARTYSAGTTEANDV